MLFLRSLIFAGLHIITAIIFSLIAVLVWPIPFKWRYIIVSQWAVLNLWLLKIICGVRYEIDGKENIGTDAAVIMCKHQSSWETLALQAVFPAQVWVLKKELLRIPFFGWGLASLRPIAIDRSAGRKALSQVIEQGKQRLSTGAWVVIFPEGTRVAKGKIGKFGIGGARMAKDAGYPVIPVAHDAGKAWPRHGFIKYPGVVRMIIGKKIQTSDMSTSEINQACYDWMFEQQTLLEGSEPVMVDKKL